MSPAEYSDLVQSGAGVCCLGLLVIVIVAIVLVRLTDPRRRSK